MSGVGIDHMRRHIIDLKVRKGHMIHHVTCLGSSEDYTSQDVTCNQVRYNT